MEITRILNEHPEQRREDGGGSGDCVHSEHS